MHSETDTGTAAAGSDPGSDAAGPDADDSGGEARDAPGRPGLGRRILLGVGAVVVAISGGVGWIVGSNGAEAVPESALFGTGVTIPTTPETFALYGIVVSLVVLGALFGLVELASRLEDGA